MEVNLKIKLWGPLMPGSPGVWLPKLSTWASRSVSHRGEFSVWHWSPRPLPGSSSESALGEAVTSGIPSLSNLGGKGCLCLPLSHGSKKHCWFSSLFWVLFVKIQQLLPSSSHVEPETGSALLLWYYRRHSSPKPSSQETEADWDREAPVPEIHFWDITLGFPISQLNHRWRRDIGCDAFYLPFSWSVNYEW